MVIKKEKAAGGNQTAIKDTQNDIALNSNESQVQTDDETHSNNWVKESNLGYAASFLDKLDPKATSWTFQTFDDDADRKNPALVKVLHGTLDEHADTLTKLQALGAGIFVTINETDFLGRKAENIKRVRALWVDLDGAPLDPVREWEEPHIIVESSPNRWHAYWLVKDVGLDEFSSIQADLISIFGADVSVKDLPRVMRLPGFVHQKREMQKGLTGEPFLVKMLKSEAFPAEFPRNEILQKIEEIKGKSHLPKAAVPANLNLLAQEHLELAGIEEIKEALEYIDPDDLPYLEWLQILFALQNHLGDLGKSIADNWSARGSKHKRNDVEGRWKGIQNGRGVTISTVFYHARQSGCDLSALARKHRVATTHNNSGQVGQNLASNATIDIIYRRFDTIKAEPIKWLWQNRIACGKFSMIAGDPGLGKSQLTAFMASVVTNGGQWPVDKTSCPIGSVIFLSAEDDAADTIRPRLEAVSANLEKVYILDAVKVQDDEGNTSQRSFNLKSDLDRLGQMMEKFGDVAMVIIDPISAYLGGTDSHKNSDIRALLAPLSELASKHKAAFIGVSHLNKGQAKQALQRITGSLAFVAAARAAFIVAKDKDLPDRRLLIPIKNNIGDDRTGFAFTIQDVSILGKIQTSRIEFEDELITERADDILADDRDAEEQSSLEAAIEFLRELCVITRTAKNVYAQADEAGFSKSTIRRAQNILKIKPVKDGLSGPWVWRLPEDAQETEDAHQNNVSTFSKFEHLRNENEIMGTT